MSEIRAIVVDPDAPNRLALAQVEQPSRDARTFYLTGGARLYGFILFHEVLARPASVGLDRLVRMVADGRVKPRIEVEAPWTEVGEIAARLIGRGYTGKAVLRVGDA